MRGSRNFCQSGFNFDNVFYFVFILVDERRDDQNTRAKIGPSSAHQQSVIQMAFRWRPDDGLALNSGLVALRFSGDPDQYC